ncbi:MAG: ABC transporter ATP-binding protein [Gammaproteobacteria bacterium]|nr:ABC transporter ATP-binding protein [Gemmatimonadota bacterium]NIR98508.1 ABC transporter ATP-binding protein [Gammaproteobacteria bacterium]NIT64686.1 ABC transporter ATP-binding protein [Gammaproteobacteria bacterium]NIV21644.1 ATP-binding cassette domain-containing protein [Gammaproteobacteria bacterium]NIW76333.1 ATP-binding cassette domain-containing protein [Gemmatimonadota bacterium]
MLEVSDINTYRGPAHILHGVSLSVDAGEVVCLVGRNGAGKTTTIESIMGLLSVRSGRITFHGNDVTGLPAHRRARLGMGYSPEDCGIFPELTVAENLMVSRWLSQSRKRDGGDGQEDEVEDRIYAVFPEVRDLTGREGLHLSGGQKKMVAIARAMALSPSLLLLDEAFEGLAPVIVSRFTEAMKKIKEMGISLLIAESNLANASRIAHRMYAIDRGEIIFHGHPEEALGNEEVMRALRG